MKKQPWLEILENLSLLSSGVGAVASIALNQASYAVAPFSVAVALGMLNRNRQDQKNRKETDLVLAAFDGRLSQQVNVLRQQISILPAPEMMHQFQKEVILKNRELTEHLYTEIATVQNELHQRLAPIERQILDTDHGLHQLEEKYGHLSEGFAQLHAGLAQLPNAVRVEQVETLIDQLNIRVAEIHHDLEMFANQTQPNLNMLQERLHRLDHQFKKLPPPIDLSAIKQEMGELVKTIADMVPKREMSLLSHEVRELRSQQDSLFRSLSAIEVAAVSLKQVFQQLPQIKFQDIDTLEEITSVRELNAFLAGPSLDEDDRHLETTFQSALNTYPELQELAANYLYYVQSQIDTMQALTETLTEQQHSLKTKVNQLPKTLDAVAIQRQITELSSRLPSREELLANLSTQVHHIVQQELQLINQQLQSFSSLPKSDLIFDLTLPEAADHHAALATGLTGSQVALEQALANTQQRLILVWPWSPQCQLDQPLMQKFAAFLQQKRRLDIGWCHMARREENRLLRKMQRGWRVDGKQQELQNTLRRLLALKRLYPEHFQFKILGTSENFLVSDQSFAVLGIADALKPSTAFSQLQLKLRISDADVVQTLTQRFDHPTLAPDDVAAYWNRAVTRHDLGDKAGAIADYTHLIQRKPTDAIAFNYRGLAHYDANHLEAAIADLTQSIQLNPVQVAAYCNRGFIRAEQGDYLGAIEDYNRAIQAQPISAIAYFYRGIAWQKLENYPEAIDSYTETIALAPDSAAAHYYRGLVWQKLENYPAAITDLERAVQLFIADGSKTNAQRAAQLLAKCRAPELQAAPPALSPSSDGSTVNALDDLDSETTTNGLQNWSTSADFPALSTETLSDFSERF